MQSRIVYIIIMNPEVLFKTKLLSTPLNDGIITFILVI